MSDRLPPFDESAEMAVIGCCINTPGECISEVGLVVTTPDFFYSVKCRTAWEVVAGMAPDAVNLLTVADKLSAMGREQAFAFLNECQDRAFSSANLPAWLDLVRDKFILRRVIRVASEAVGAAYDGGSSGDVLDAFERDVLAIRLANKDESNIKTLLREAVSIIEQRVSNGGQISGLSTGLLDLDRKSDGLHPGELIVLAAFPSCGKTALDVNIAVHNALAGVPVGILSAEMRPVQLALRSLCGEARVNFREVVEGDFTALVTQAGRLANAPLYIQQCNGWSIGQAQAQARRWQQKYGIKLLVADYIQRFTGIGENREREIASIGAGFKNVALELGIPIIALSQINDDGKLRESRALGQDGDSVWKLENDGERQPKAQSVLLRIEKCRDGEVGNVPLTFLKPFTKFESQSKYHEPSGYNPSDD